MAEVSVYTVKLEMQNCQREGSGKQAVKTLK